MTNLPLTTRVCDDTITELEHLHRQDQTKITELQLQLEKEKEATRNALADRDQVSKQLTKVREANEQLAKNCEENDALKAQVNELRTACEAVKHALQNNDIEGHVLWILPPYQAPAIHETAFDRLEGVLEQSTQQFLRDHDVALVMDLQQRCKGHHPLWGRAHIFLGEQRDRILKESDRNLGVSDE